MHFAHKILFAQNTINKLISQRVNHFLLFSDFSLTYILTFNYSLISTTTTPCNPILSKLTKTKLENMNMVRRGSQTAASKEVSLGIFALGGLLGLSKKTITALYRIFEVPKFFLIASLFLWLGPHHFPYQHLFHCTVSHNRPHKRTSRAGSISFIYLPENKEVA